MDDPRGDHARLLLKQQRLVNGTRRQMAEEVKAAVLARCGDRPSYDIACHYAVMRDVDAIMNRYYGAYRGDQRAILLGTITQATRAAYELACRRFREATARYLLRFAPDLLVQLQARAKAKDEQ